MEVIKHDSKEQEITIYSDDMPLDAWRAYGYDENPENEILIAYGADYNDVCVDILGAWDGNTNLSLSVNDVDTLKSEVRGYLESIKEENSEFFLGESAEKPFVDCRINPNM